MGIKYCATFFLFSMILTSILGCSSPNIKNMDNTYDSTPFFILTTPNNLKEELSKRPYIYKMLYFDFHKTKEREEVFKKFGDSLDKYGIVAYLSDTPENYQKRYFEYLQKRIGTNFDYYNSPFLVFLRENNKGDIEPINILSFSNAPLECIREQLDKIEREIYLSENKDVLIQRLEKLKLLACSVTNEELPIINKLINTIEEMLFSNG